MDYATLKSLKPGEFEDAADAYRGASAMASEAKDRVEQRISARMRRDLSGKTASAALRQLRQVGKNFHYAQTECGLLATALNGLAFELKAAQKKLESALDSLGEGFKVREDGSVYYPPPKEKVDGKLPAGGVVTGHAAGRDSGVLDPSGPANDAATALERQADMLDPNQNPNRARAQRIANRIAAAVQEATEVDQKWAPKLRRLRADDDLTVSKSDWMDVQKDTRSVRETSEDYLGHIAEDPPKKGSPQENASWWKGLPQDAKHAYVSVHPASVGAMDGLPSDVRDEANRTVLAERRAAYQTELQSIPPPPPTMAGNSYERSKWKEEHEGRIKHLERALDGMDAIQRRFDRTGDRGLPEAYLLGFDPEGTRDGRVIIANGNPDKADHTGVYVPGTTTNMGNIGGGPDDSGGGNLERSENLWRGSQQLEPSGSMSTITWFDYNAPDSIIPIKDGDLVPEASRAGYAQEGAPALSDFMRGIEVAQGGSEGHSTLIGHSYGSTVIGEAAKGRGDGDPLADDIVAVGSPGMQVSRARELGIDSDRVWGMASSFGQDPVPSMGRLVGLGEDSVVPTDREFGGNIMRSDSESHSGYWDEGSISLMNQAAVIAGARGEVDLDR
ncbi:hypothetical protein E0L36_22535 [Streptomyces sp. AJS327]|uniref:alpha/beta hydrolase n=1 Tax=Streptomyces sp. AJS327 TaxID=2545265 RepID=UPI0015E05604|nr:alpha/beta hydrolase [Streptomyces sp. AJS327]MBA0053553.1 hypothetical protein [Streptomyces sp. AJS327]